MSVNEAASVAAIPKVKPRNCGLLETGIILADVLAIEQPFFTPSGKPVFKRLIGVYQGIVAVQYQERIGANR